MISRRTVSDKSVKKMNNSEKPIPSNKKLYALS